MAVFSSVRLSTNLMFIMIFGVFKQAPLYFNTNVIKSQTVLHMCRCAYGLTFTWCLTKVRWSPPRGSSFLLQQLLIVANRKRLASPRQMCQVVPSRLHRCSKAVVTLLSEAVETGELMRTQFFISLPTCCLLICSCLLFECSQLQFVAGLIELLQVCALYYFLTVFFFVLGSFFFIIQAEYCTYQWHFIIPV